MMFHNTEKTETCHGNAPQILFGARTTTPKWLTEAGFAFVLHKLVLKCFACRLMRAETTKCAYFLIRKAICDWKHALERLKNNEESMQHKDAHDYVLSQVYLIAVKN